MRVWHQEPKVARVARIHTVKHLGFVDDNAVLPKALESQRENRSFDPDLFG